MNINNDPPVESNSNRPGWLTRKIYETQAEKRRDFWIGFGLWWVLNIILVLCIWGAFALTGYSSGALNFTTSTYSNVYSVLTCLIGTLPWVLNFGLIVYFTLTRSQIALGMVAAFAVALLITLCLGVIFMVWCFYALSGNQGL